MTKRPDSTKPEDISSANKGFPFACFNICLISPAGVMYMSEVDKKLQNVTTLIVFDIKSVAEYGDYILIIQRSKPTNSCTRKST